MICCTGPNLIHRCLTLTLQLQSQLQSQLKMEDHANDATEEEMDADSDDANEQEEMDSDSELFDLADLEDGSRAAAPAASSATVAKPTMIHLPSFTSPLPLLHVWAIEAGQEMWRRKSSQIELEAPALRMGELKLFLEWCGGAILRKRLTA